MSDRPIIDTSFRASTKHRLYRSGFKQLKKALLEGALGAELAEHLGYEMGDPAGCGTGNSRNGHSDKTVLTEDGAVELAVPRDRNGTFEPVILPKGERRLESFDDRILSLHARHDGTSPRASVKRAHRGPRSPLGKRDHRCQRL